MGKQIEEAQIDLPHLQILTGWSATKIYRWINEHGFPRSNIHSNKKAYWNRKEVEEQFNKPITMGNDDELEDE